MAKIRINRSFVTEIDGQERFIEYSADEVTARKAYAEFEIEKLPKQAVGVSNKLFHIIRYSPAGDVKGNFQNIGGKMYAPEGLELQKRVIYTGEGIVTSGDVPKKERCVSAFRSLYPSTILEEDTSSERRFRRSILKKPFLSGIITEILD